MRHMSKLIYLTQGKVTQVDDEDYEELNKHKWYALKGIHTYYAARKVRTNGKCIMVSMHKHLMNTPANRDTDHIDGDGLNNTKANLQISTRRKNAQNTINHRNGRLFGAYFHKKVGKWHSRISIDGHRLNLGFYDTELEAHNAYVSRCELLEMI
jgi:hypothetical protein